jgi:hypothetical protein
MCVVLAGIGLPLVDAQVGGADYDIPNGHFYTQTNGGAGPQFGYRITNEGGIGFWDQFQKLGGVTALGYPASRRFLMDGFFVQATQKYILQWRPETASVAFVNVFDKLHDQGKDAALQQQFSIPAPADPSIDQATRLGWLNADPAVAKQYGTGPAAIQTNGLPTSQITPMGPFNVLRAQRDAIQKWNIDGPGGIKAGSVSVVNGGDVAKQLGLVTADAAITETAQGQPAATPTPVATNTPVATPTPAFEYKSKAITDPPVDCNADSTLSAIVCQAVAPNAGTQYIKGRVMNQKGDHLQWVVVQATIPGVSCNNSQGVSVTPCVLTQQTAGDGTFTVYIGGNVPPGALGGNGTAACPPYPLTYQFMVLSNTGAQDSDIYTVNYDGNCNSDGEFHFDFVKVR